MRTPLVTLALVIFSATTGCVSAGKYDEAIAKAQRSELARADANRRLAAQEAELERLKRSIEEAERHCARTMVELQATSESALGCSKALDEATAMNQELRKELERLGRDADALLSAKGALAVSLQQARARLEELRRAQAAAEARAQLFRDIALRLKRAFLIESGMRPETLSAAGYGEFDPVAANDSPEHKTQNRRIEITLQPNIDELVTVPQSH